MQFLEVAQVVKLQILQSRKDRGPMKSPGSGIEPDTRDLPSSDPRPDPSWGISQLAGKLRYGHKALSGIRARGIGHVADCNIVPAMVTHQVGTVVF
jgi:hypothetical protein